MTANDIKENNIQEQEESEIREKYIQITRLMKQNGSDDMTLLNKAFTMARDRHSGVRRTTGELYIHHPLEVARILAEDLHSVEVVAAALLHDVIEDCDVTKEDMEKQFGELIADIVDSVTKVSRAELEEKDVTKMELDELSDEKFLSLASEHREAIYIKCADRLHNLSTIGDFPDAKKRAKADHTRKVIIPCARIIHANRLADDLSDRCLKIENPEVYRGIRERYRLILRENTCVLGGTANSKKGALDCLQKLVVEHPVPGCVVKGVMFRKRSIDRIHRELTSMTGNCSALISCFTKYSIPLYDVYIIMDNNNKFSPDSAFASYCSLLSGSPFRFAVTGTYEDEHESCYIMKDRYENRYRVFVQSEKEHMEFLHGEIGRTKIRFSGPNQAEPMAPERKMITVYRKDGTAMEIEEGSTVLDFAFAIDRNVGLCADHARINRSTSEIPLSRTLQYGDQIEIITHHDKHAPEDDRPHAVIGWFNYLHDRKAIKYLTAYFEQQADLAPMMIRVKEKSGREHEVEHASTVLDFLLTRTEDHGDHVEWVYLNDSPEPAELNKTLRDGDKLRLQINKGYVRRPDIRWFCIVKTDEAKEYLATYFEKLQRKKEKK